MTSDRFDYLIVGGGLQGGLIALALRAFQPSASVGLVERSADLGGNHTWSFHAGDLPAEVASYVEPMLEARWPAYAVRFPGLERTVPSPYASIVSDRFADAVRSAFDAPGWLLSNGVEARSVTRDRVDLADGSVMEARCVIDARGPSPEPADRCGFQKFLGLEVETDRPWPERLPSVMDATVTQDDGYRFVYTLPFGPTRVLVEDTYFSDAPDLDEPTLRGRVAEYLGSHGIHRWTLLRQESGVLPMPWSGRAGLVSDEAPLVAGYGGGWFHPATGYSFPLAVRLAVAVARSKPEEAKREASILAARMAPRQRFARLLNRLLFRAVVPKCRWQVFRRLYRDLPDSLMARFYAMEFTALDAARMLIGPPPPLAPLRLLGRLEPRTCPLPSH